MTKIGVCVFAHMEREAIDHRDSPDLMSVLSREGDEPTDKSHTTHTSAEDAAGARRVLRVPVRTKYYSADAMFWLFANYAQLNSWLDKGRPALTSASQDGSQEEGEVLAFVARIDLKNVDDELMTNLQRAIRGPIAETQAILLKGSSEDYSEQYDRLQTFCTKNCVELIETTPSKTTKETLSGYKEKYGLSRFREVLFAVEWPCRRPKPNPFEQPEHRAYLRNQIASLETKEATAGHTTAQPTKTQSSPAKTAKTLTNDGAQLEKKASSSSAMKTTAGHDGAQSEKEKAQSSSSATAAKDAATSSGACFEKPHSSRDTKAGVKKTSYLEWPPSFELQAEILEAFGDILNDEKIFVQPSSNFNPSAQKPSTSSAPPAGEIILSPESAERMAQEARDATLPGDLFFMSLEPSLTAQLDSLAMSTEMMKELDKAGLGMNIFTGKPLGMKQQGSKLERDERVAFAEKVSLSVLKKLNDAGGGSSSADENLADQKTKDDEKKELAKDDENDAVVKEENSSKDKRD